MFFFLMVVRSCATGARVRTEVVIGHCRFFTSNYMSPAAKINEVYPACLIVIDGWGLSSLDSSHSHPNLIKYDAIRNAKTPVMSSLMTRDNFARPATEDLPDQDNKQNCREIISWLGLSAHGSSVGLPKGLMGNSEVGHLNIGAGRIVPQVLLFANRICNFALQLESSRILFELTHLFVKINFCNKTI